MATAVSIKSVRTLKQSWSGEASALFYFLTEGQGEVDAFQSIRIGINPVLHARYHEVDAVTRHAQGHWQVTCNLPGLIGPMATLPIYDQVSLVANNPEKSDAVLALFNSFHHRLVSYRYITWLHKRPVLSYHTQVAYSASTHLDNKKHAKPSHSHKALAYLSGQQSSPSAVTHFLQAQALSLRTRPLSRVVIEALLCAYFKMSMVLSTHVPSRCAIPEEEQTRLSIHHCGNQLGKETILGSNLWLCAQHSTLTIGPLSYKEFLALLPGGHMLHQLKAMLRHLMPANMATSATLILNKNAIPRLQLHAQPFRLGWNSWLCADSYQNDAKDSQLRLS